MRKVVQMADIRQNNTLITPIGALQDVIADIEAETADAEFTTDGIIIIRVCRKNDRSSFGFTLSRVRASECIAFLERFKLMIIGWMDGDG